jgi:hypothetical protein
MIKAKTCRCTELTGLARHDCPHCGGEGIVPAVESVVVTIHGALLAGDELDGLEEAFVNGRLELGEQTFNGRRITVERLELPRTKRANDVFLLDRSTLTCPHGNPPSECDACFRAADLAFDADREDRFR